MNETHQLWILALLAGTFTVALLSSGDHYNRPPARTSSPPDWNTETSTSGSQIQQYAAEQQEPDDFSTSTCYCRIDDDCPVSLRCKDCIMIHNGIGNGSPEQDSLADGSVVAVLLTTRSEKVILETNAIMQMFSSSADNTSMLLLAKRISSKHADQYGRQEAAYLEIARFSLDGGCRAVVSAVDRSYDHPRRGSTHRAVIWLVVGLLVVVVIVGIVSLIEHTGLLHRLGTNPINPSVHSV